MGEQQQPHTAPQQITLPGVVVNTTLAPGPDGTAWVQISIQHGAAVMVLLVPHQTAEELAVIFGRDLPTAAAAARRAGLGLIVPNGKATLAQPGRPNGSG